MVEEKLKKLGITLPQQQKSLANYLPFVQAKSLVFISGQLPVVDNKVQFIGQLGASVMVDQGIEAARICAINILSHLRVACNGDWNKIKTCVRIGGFVNATSSFTEHSKVINGASDLIVDVLGNRARHSRFAIGANSLPLGSAVEVDAIFELIE